MDAARFTLRFVAGVNIGAATYGSADYGASTYGQRASDPLEFNVYLPVPLPGGYPTAPSWIYRRGDTVPPFRCQILGDETRPLDLTGVASARLVVAPVDGSDATRRTYKLTMEDRTKGIVRRDWIDTDLAARKVTYIVGIVLDYASGRRLTVPHDSRLVFAVGGQDALNL